MSGIYERAQHAVSAHKVPVVAAGIVLASMLLGTLLNANASIPQPWNRVSSIIGWVYFFCWAVGFYPQVLLNYRRKSTEGYSLDMAVLGILGFASYAAFNCAFYYSEHVQQAYMALHDGHRNTVEVNDVFFSLHATTLVAVAISQCWLYPGNLDVSRLTLLIVGATLGVAATIAVIIVLPAWLPLKVSGQLSVLDLLYYFSYVKLGSTFAKEVPQMLLNHRRKCTFGWSIYPVLLDNCGCTLSMAQQVLDSWAIGDWAAITGNPVKFLLAFVSLSINSVYMMQHYVWYADENAEHETTPLLVNQPLLVGAKVTPSGLRMSTSWLTLVALHGTDHHALDKTFWDASAELSRV